MTSKLYLCITTFVLLLYSNISVADKNQTALIRTREDLATFSTLKKKLDKHPDDIKLQGEAIKTLGHAAFRVFFYDRMDMPQAEKMMIYFTHARLLSSFRPHHYDIMQYAGFLFKAADMDTYDMKLISAEAQLMYVEFEEDLAYTIHRLRITREKLIAMENQQITLSPGMEQYQEWSKLDCSDSRRRYLLNKVEQILNSYPAEVYYETANTMLGWYYELKTNTSAANRHFDTYHFALNKSIEFGYPDAYCPFARRNEYEGNKTLALLAYRLSAKSGGIDGKLNTARMIIEDTCSSQKDYDEALLLLQSVRQHPLFSNKGGEVLLGRMYEYGLGVSQNDSLALHYYQGAYQSMRIHKGIGKNNRYENKMYKKATMQLKALNADINRLLNRKHTNDLIQYAKSLNHEQIDPDKWLMLACRFYLLGDDISGIYYMELAAKQGSKDAQSILKWHQQSPQFPVINIIHLTLK